MEFGLLGPLMVRSAQTAIPVKAPQQRVLLVALLLRANQVISVDELADILWGAAPPPSARVTVQNYVKRLRHALRDADHSRISTRSAGYLIRASADELDVMRFEALAEGGREAAAHEDWPLASARLRAALALWRGAPLEDVQGDSLFRLELSRLREMHLQALQAWAAADLHLGLHAEIIPELTQLVAVHPLCEHLHALLMLALYRSGRQGDALAAYAVARRLLIKELGVEPGRDLATLHQRILTADPELELRASVTAGQPPEPALAASRIGATLADEPGIEPGPTVAAGAAGAGGVVTFSLPPDTAGFTGRSRELGQITAAVTSAAGAGGVVAVRAISGMPGAGKTALAVRAAHLLREEFADRQLFVSLHAHTPGHEPVRPEDALAGLLTATGVDPRFLPAGLDERAAMWRDKMAGQRALLVLDNAADSGQVAPLLPGAAGCLVLVTSRRHLGDLPGVVTSVLLDVLAPGEAQEMFTRLALRAADFPGEVTEVAELAGHLPLAISLLARVLARHPAWALADLAAETRVGLLTLAAEHDSVAAAFDLSYRHLDPARQRLFCLLGLHPGATTDAYAAAALVGASVDEAAVLLDGLHAEGLLTEAGHRRYGMHDLLRHYARDRAPADLGAGESEQAVSRLLDYYQHAAALAEARLARQTRPGPAPAAPASLAVPALGDAGQALAWARADRASLLACLDHATRTGQHARVIALTAGLAGLWRHDGPWPDAITRHTAAVQAAQKLGDRLGQANAVTDLVEVRRLTGDYPGAAQALDQALSNYRDLGDRLGQANVLARLGTVRQLTSDFPGASAALEQAMSLYCDLDDKPGQANVLTLLGEVRRQAGDYPGVVQAHEQALRLYHDLGDQLGQANAVTNLGIARRLTGDYPGAAAALEQALGISHGLGYRLGQAIALTYLGSVRRLTGDYPGAAAALEQALGISHDLGDRYGQAAALTYLGSVRRLTGDYPGAAAALEEALGISHGLGDRSGQAEALNETGTLHRVSGDFTRAVQCHQQALDLARTIASPWDEAHALAGLGRCALAVGDITQAKDLLRQAHQIFQQAGDAEAAGVLAELDAVARPETA